MSRTYGVRVNWQIERQITSPERQITLSYLQKRTTIVPAEFRKLIIVVLSVAIKFRPVIIVQILRSNPVPKALDSQINKSFID